MILNVSSFITVCTSWNNCRRCRRFFPTDTYIIGVIANPTQTSFVSLSYLSLKSYFLILKGNQYNTKIFYFLLKKTIFVAENFCDTLTS